MTSLNNSSNKPLVNKTLVFLGIAVSVVGFLDATYLTIKHYQGSLPYCTIVHGCEKVLTSPYATIVGIPVALMGAIYYAVILIGLVAYLDTKRTDLLKATALGTTIGLLASSYFFYLQLAVIRYWCQYCIVSIITSTLLFVVGMFIYRSLPKKELV
jgi:uncharacterized membrane protein